MTSNWGDVPVVLRDKPFPALVRTGSVMAQYGATLALVGGTYATVDVSGAVWQHRPCGPVLGCTAYANTDACRLLLD